MKIEKLDKHRKVISAPLGSELREHLGAGTKFSFESNFESSLLHKCMHWGKNILLQELCHHNFSLEEPESEKGRYYPKKINDNKTSIE